MDALTREFESQRAFIEACEDVDALLGWMREYREAARAAAEGGDARARLRYDDLAELAEDRVVELKAARRAAPPIEAPHGREHREGARPAARAASVPPADPPPPDSEVERARREAREARERETANRRAAEEAKRAADEDRSALRRQADDAERRRVAAEERLARIQEENARAAEEHAQEMARLRADERGRARTAATQVEQRGQPPQQPAVLARPPASVPTQPSRAPVAQVPAPTRPDHRVPPIRTQPPAATPWPGRRATTPSRTQSRPHVSSPGPRPADDAELTPLARLFQERLSDTMAPPSQPASAPPAVPPRPDARPANVAPQAPGEPDDLPLLTGADLASYRAWLGVSQRVLAARFGVEQGTISKGESNPRALLGPTLRRALHVAMGQPRDDVPMPTSSATPTSQAS